MWVLLVMLSVTVAADMNMFERVWQNISTGYGVFIPQVNVSEPLSVAVYTEVGRLIEVVGEVFEKCNRKLFLQNEAAESITMDLYRVYVSVHLCCKPIGCQTWTDPRLTWNLDEMQGVTKIRVPYMNVWHPDITTTVGK